MSADWYFLKTGFFHRHSTIGPITDQEFLGKIARGEVKPETMVSSTTKTHGHWIPMKQIRAAMAHWDQTHPKAGSRI